MEKVPNMQSVTPDAIPLLEDAPMQLIRRLGALAAHSSRGSHYGTSHCPANFYPEVNAYSLLNPDSLQIYFLDFNKVLTTRPYPREYR